MASFVVCVLILSSLESVKSELLRGLEVPQYAFVGGSATLVCSYDLRTTPLYSLKWYHNREEFYRFVPTERDKPINIGPTHKFILREVVRTDSRNMLSLSQLSPNASGEYQCELIAEHPSFRTEEMKATMVVLEEQLHPPIIVGVKNIYEPEDVIEITCHPQKSSLKRPQPSLKWYLDKQMVGPEKLLNYNYSYRKQRPELTLRISAKEVIDSGGTMTAECRLNLGNHQQKAYRVLRVRTTHTSLLSNFYSKGSGIVKEIWWLLTNIILILVFVL